MPMLTMMIAYIVKQLLVLFRYPRQPGSFSGQHAVGAVQLRLPNGSTACQIHYPTTTTAAEKATAHPYFRPEAAQGLSDYTRSPPKMLEFLVAKQHPCAVHAEPIASNHRGCKFPLIVFSHGLAGCMEMYTQLCAQVASHGYIVVALEHEDGSACFAETALGERIDYQRPDDTPYSRQKVLSFRGPMLQQRVREVEAAIEFFASSSETNSRIQSSNGTTATSVAEDGKLALLHKIIAATDMSQGVALLGHSFGAATMLLVEQNLASSPRADICSVATLDPWCFALPDAVLEQGTTAPLLSVLSESWTTNRETAQVVQLLEHSNVVASLWAPHTVHQSFSDTNSFFPSFIAKRMYMRGAKEERFATPRIVGQACASHFGSSFGTGGNDHTNVVAETTSPGLQPFTKQVEAFAAT